MGVRGSGRQSSIVRAVIAATLGARRLSSHDGTAPDPYWAKRSIRQKLSNSQLVEAVSSLLFSNLNVSNPGEHDQRRSD
jgi:hypothetical protein